MAHVDDNTGRLIGELPDGSRLPTSVLDELACNAMITGAVFDRHGKAIWKTSARRNADTTQRRILNTKWGGCFHCRANFAICQPHHIEPFSQGGPTRVANLVPACWACHQLIHRDGWQIHRSLDGNHTLHPPQRIHLEPEQPPPITADPPMPTGPPLVAGPPMFTATLAPEGACGSLGPAPPPTQAIPPTDLWTETETGCDSPAPGPAPTQAIPPTGLSCEPKTACGNPAPEPAQTQVIPPTDLRTEPTTACDSPAPEPAPTQAVPPTDLRTESKTACGRPVPGSTPTRSGSSPLAPLTLGVEPQLRTASGVSTGPAAARATLRNARAVRAGHSARDGPG